MHMWSHHRAARLGLWGVVFLSLAAAAVPALGVVGGRPANRADHPYFAVVGSGCGGALVAPDRVLTAAHCREVVNVGGRVRVGPAGVTRRVMLLAVHPLNVRLQARAQREFPPEAADLMLLRLNAPVPGITPIALAPAASGLTAPGTTVVTIGRGAFRATGGGGGTFRSGTVQVVDPTRVCRDEMPTAAQRAWSLCTIDPRALVAGERPPFVSACFGDSGGPLLATGPEGPLLVGVVSWGPACGSRRDPEVYANAVRATDFITDPRPVWAPAPAGAPRLVGAARVGGTLTCRVRWLVRPHRVTYMFTVNDRWVQEGTGATFRPTARHAGGVVRCDASGMTAGGPGGTVRSAPVRLAG